MVDISRYRDRISVYAVGGPDEAEDLTPAEAREVAAQLVAAADAADVEAAAVKAA